MWTDDKSMSYFVGMQERLNPTISIEVGAHDADYSKLMTKNNISVYAFEASAPVYNKFKDLMAGINYINAAVTDYDGEVEFNFIAGKDPSKIGHNGIKEGRWKIANTTTVQCYSLDSYFKDIKDQNIALWIDCEGANKEVLEGAKNILEQVSSIYIEVEHTQLWKDIWTRADVISYLDEQGFEMIKEYPAYDDQTNCIFVRKELVASL
jgi:FkbM family methyltransferase